MPEIQVQSFHLLLLKVVPASNTAFLVYLNTYFMCDTWPYDS